MSIQGTDQCASLFHWLVVHTGVSISGHWCVMAALLSPSVIAVLRVDSVATVQWGWELYLSVYTAHAQKTLPFFPSLVTGKGSIFLSIFGHMELCQCAVAFWWRTNIPILCGICAFWNAFLPILPDCRYSIWTLKGDTRIFFFKGLDRNCNWLQLLPSKRICLFTV